MFPPRRTHVHLPLRARSDFVPDMQRRTIMNLVLLAGAAVPVAWLGGGFVYFFVPPSGGGGGGGLTAKDANGDDVTAAAWAKLHPYPDRALVQDAAAGRVGDAKAGSGLGQVTSRAFENGITSAAIPRDTSDLAVDAPSRGRRLGDGE